MSFRSTRTLLNDASKYASPHKYTYVEGRTPFWRKFRSLLVVNPDISSGLPMPQTNRNPAPGSRPERQATMPSRASDIAGNKYHNRDFRRMYPKLDMITQGDLTQLLLATPNEDGTKSLHDPSEEASTAVSRPTDLTSPAAFTDVLAQVHGGASGPHYTASKLPPTPPFVRPQHVLVKNPGDIPHAEHAYFEVENYKSR